MGKTKDPQANMKIVDVEEIETKVNRRLKIFPWLYAIIGFLTLCLPLCFFYGRQVEFQRLVDLISESSVLKAKANELEEEIVTLKNYSVLIDALALDGRASRRFVKGAYLGTDTIIDTVRGFYPLESDSMLISVEE